MRLTVRGTRGALTVATPVQRDGRWVTVGGLTLVSFLLLLDDTALSVALPTIQRQFGLDLGTLEWVINAYTLTLATFALLGGRLADRNGRRRMLVIGLAVFIAASLAVGLAPTAAVLIGGRAIQGLGAALVAPASLAIIADAFPRNERGLGIGVWAGVSASALGFGPLFGAILTDTIGWAWIFLLNVPLCFGAWLLARVTIRESRAPEVPRQLDISGAVAAGVGLLAVLLALTQANGAGWTSPRVSIFFAVSIISFGVFAWHEQRTRAPLLDLSLFLTRAFAGANVLILMATAVMCSLFFFLALYLQTVLGYSALRSAVTVLPLVGTVIVVAPLAGRWADAVGSRAPVTVGLLVLTGGLLGLSELGVDSHAASLIPWLLLAGLGIGCVTTPTATAALGSTNSSDYGTLAALYSTFQAIGLTLGIAIMGAILASFGPGAAFTRGFDSAHHVAFVHGFSTALKVNASIAFVGALLAAWTLGPRRRHDVHVGGAS